MSDIKDSGMIEQEAGLVISIYKDKSNITDINAVCDLDLELLKNRHGPLGIVPCTWYPNIMTVKDRQEMPDIY